MYGAMLVYKHIAQFDSKRSRVQVALRNYAICSCIQN